MTEVAASQTEAGTGNGEGEGSGDVSTPTWIEQLPEAMRGNESLHSFKTIGDYVEANNTLSAEREGSVKMLGEDATDEDKNAFATKMGRPEAPEGYQIGKPDDLPEGVEYNEELEGAYRKMAFDLGMPAKQAEGMYAWYNALVAKSEGDRMIAEQEVLDKAVNTLKDEWKGDAYKVNVELAHRVFVKFAGEEGQKFISETKVGGLTLGSHPLFVKAFHGIAKLVANDALDTGRNGGNGLLSEEQKAQARFPNTKFKT